MSDQAQGKRRFLVRVRNGYAFRFGARIAEVVADREASLFDAQNEAAAAVLRCGVCSRGLAIEEVTEKGERIDLRNFAVEVEAAPRAMTNDKGTNDKGMSKEG